MTRSVDDPRPGEIPVHTDLPFTRDDFGADFTWGVASAAFQVEGAWDEDGKRPSVWDEACLRGRVRGGRACLDGIDAYHRVEQDLDLLAALGIGAYRFSINWPRVFGDGRGPWNPAGASYYDLLIDGCLARGIEPWVTVHHWDMPLALEREGGWLRRATIDDFARFAAEVAQRYGDRVKNWMVMNEPLSIVGHALLGVHRRRTGLYPMAALATLHHLNLACAQGARRMRDVLPQDAKIGVTHVFTLAWPYDRVGRGARARRAMDALLVDAFLDPAAGLGYPLAICPPLRPIRRFVEDGDEELARVDYDFIGVQYYGPVPTRPARLVGVLPRFSVPSAEASVRSGVGVPVDPDGLLEVLRRYRSHPACRRFVVTESGFGMNDRPGGDGRIRDDIRIWYARTHLERVLAAKREGIPVDGFFQWSWADNIEWMFGRTVRFGLVYIDYENDFRRIPKDSYYWFRGLLAGDRVTSPSVSGSRQGR